MRNCWNEHADRESPRRSHCPRKSLNMLLIYERLHCPSDGATGRGAAARTAQIQLGAFHLCRVRFAPRVIRSEVVLLVHASLQEQLGHAACQQPTGLSIRQSRQGDIDAVRTLLYCVLRIESEAVMSCTSETSQQCLKPNFTKYVRVF